MSSIFNLKDNDDFSQKINLDDLYDKKKQYDLKQLNIFNKILNSIHNRIKTTSRQRMNQQYCFYVVQEIILGVPKYDHAKCIAYLIDKLKDNDFCVSYIHPNTLFISWRHWVPSYVRQEIKKKTGINLDQFGNPIDKNSEGKKINNQNSDNVDDLLIDLKYNPEYFEENKKEYKSVKSYKPLGNLIYDDKTISKFKDK